jgi:predicted dehydrogenase
MIAAGMIGEILEMRGRGKEDSRVGGQDLMVLGTHILDLMRFLAGDARWCHARVGVRDKERVRSITKADIRDGGEGMGPIAGDHITAMYGFDNGVIGHFCSQRSERRAGEPDRFGLQIFGSRGIIQVRTGGVPPVYYLADPGWFPAQTKAAWQLVSSAGIGKPETLKDSLGQGNIWIAQDLMEAIEQERQPRGSMYDGRAALEMIMAVYESHRAGRTVDIPLKSRRQPLSLL